MKNKNKLEIILVEAAAWTGVFAVGLIIGIVTF